MQGDLMIFGGSATIEKGATVNGNVVVFGGSLTINGNVNQDAVIFGGTATLGATAHILGNLSTLSSTFNRPRVPWWMARLTPPTIILEKGGVGLSRQP